MRATVVGRPDACSTTVTAAALWLAVRLAIGRVHQAGCLLDTAGIDAATVRRGMGGLLEAMALHRPAAGNLAGPRAIS